MIIRRNNPGNIRKNPQDKWKGELPGIPANQYLEFDTLENGSRAMLKLLNNYILKYKKDSIDKIIRRWAPKEENPTENYISFVANRTGIGRNETLYGNDWNTLARIAYQMTFFEHGIKNDDGSLSAAMDRAKWALENEKKKDSEPIVKSNDNMLIGVGIGMIVTGLLID